MRSWVRPSNPRTVDANSGLRPGISIRPTTISARGDRITQFARALTELNIDIICATIPQAKGRVCKGPKKVRQSKEK